MAARSVYHRNASTSKVRDKTMTYEEAVQQIPLGRYRHYKGNEYEVLAIAHHSESLEPMVVYKALYGEGEVWVRPASMWNEVITRGGHTFRRFEMAEEVQQ